MAELRAQRVNSVEVRDEKKNIVGRILWIPQLSALGAQPTSYSAALSLIVGTCGIECNRCLTQHLEDSCTCKWLRRCIVAADVVGSKAEQYAISVLFFTRLPVKQTHHNGSTLST